jgi:hypothetical protein
MQETVGYQMAVAGVGLALVFFAIAAGAILTSGHDPTQAFWTLATGLAGALIGILAPSPPRTKGGAAGQAALDAHTLAAATARELARQQQARAAQALATHDTSTAQDAAAQADEAAQTADAHAHAAASLQKVPWSIAVPGLLLIAAACELVLFLQPAHLTSDLSKQLQGFASAAAGGAIGSLAPSPSNKSAT